MKQKHSLKAQGEGVSILVMNDAVGLMVRAKKIRESEAALLLEQLREASQTLSYLGPVQTELREWISGRAGT